VSKSEIVFRTAGDLEVVLLQEIHSLLADLISDEYYRTLGEPPTEVRFHSVSALHDFYVHVDELLSLGPGNVAIPGVPAHISLLDGLA